MKLAIDARRGQVKMAGMEMLRSLVLKMKPILYREGPELAGRPVVGEHTSCEVSRKSVEPAMDIVLVFCLWQCKV